MAIQTSAILPKSSAHYQVQLHWIWMIGIVNGSWV